MVEVGFVPTFRPRPFPLHFEFFPIWLLSLEKTFCSHLTILGVASAHSLRSKLEAMAAPVVLAHRAIVRLGLARVSYSSVIRPPVDAITLVSGSPVFLQSASELLRGQAALFLGCSHHSAKRPPPGPARIRLSHRSFGGPTHFVALFGCQDIPCRPHETTLRRSVGHIFDFGARPDPVDPSAEALSLDINGILHPLDLEWPILHPTSFYRSGWGCRSLTPEELGIAFGFPAWLRAGGLTMEMFPCVPLQIMDACIREVLDDTAGFVSPLAARLFDTPVAPVGATWMPGIKRFLPHAWVPEDVITDKAVKHDDAAVHTAMWDNRITLVHPWSPPQALRILHTYRTYLIRSYRHRLLTELRGYMVRTHGDFWYRRLDFLRSPAGKAYTQFEPSLLGKRSCPSGSPEGGQSGRPRQRGGLEGFIGEKTGETETSSTTRSSIASLTRSTRLSTASSSKTLMLVLMY